MVFAGGGGGTGGRGGGNGDNCTWTTVKKKRKFYKINCDAVLVSADEKLVQIRF